MLKWRPHFFQHPAIKLTRAARYLKPDLTTKLTGDLPYQMVQAAGNAGKLDNPQAS
jgi:hypothetical protein